MTRRLKVVARAVVRKLCLRVRHCALDIQTLALFVKSFPDKKKGHLSVDLFQRTKWPPRLIPYQHSLKGHLRSRCTTIQFVFMPL